MGSSKKPCQPGHFTGLGIKTFRRPYKANPGLAAIAREAVDRTFQKTGKSLPTIDDSLYSDDVRREAQERIKIHYKGFQKNDWLDQGMLSQGFAYMDLVVFEDGQNFEEICRELNHEFGALDTDLECVVGEESKIFPDKNYRLVQRVPYDMKGLPFGLYIRFEAKK